MLFIKFPLTKNDIPFETLVKIPPNINTESTNLFFDFSGYKMNLTGKDGRVGGRYHKYYLFRDVYLS